MTIKVVSQLFFFQSPGFLFNILERLFTNPEDKAADEVPPCCRHDRRNNEGRWKYDCMREDIGLSLALQIKMYKIREEQSVN